MTDVTGDKKRELLMKYAQGLEEIWKTLIEEGPESGDPLALFDAAIQKTETALAGLLK